MAISVEVDDHAVRILVADIAEAASGINGRIADVYQEVGPTMLASAKKFTPVDTGTLRASLDFRVNKRVPSLRLGPLKTNVNPKTGQRARDYARYVHDGTSVMPPRPFIRRAIEKHSGPSSKLMRGLSKAGVTPIDRKVIF